MIELTSKGKKTVKIIDNLAKKSPLLAQRILNEIGAQSLKESKEYVPIDTASLISTGRVVEERGIVRVLYGGIMAKFTKSGKQKRFVNYAKFVHDGTSKQPGTFFLEKGVFKAISNINRIAKVAMNNWLSFFK